MKPILLLVLFISLVIIFFSCIKKGIPLSAQEEIKMQFENRNIPFQEKTTFKVGDDSYEIFYEKFNFAYKTYRYKTHIFKNGENITSQFIKGDYELTLENALKNTQLVSPDQSYFLVPMQYGAKLIRTKDLSYFNSKLRYSNQEEYLGNIIYSKYMLGISKKSIKLEHLETEFRYDIDFLNDTEVIWAERTPEGNLYLKLKENGKVFYKELLIPSLEFKNSTTPPTSSKSENPIAQPEVTRAENKVTYKANGNSYEISYLDWEEIHRGAMADRVSIVMNGENLTSKYLGREPGYFLPLGSKTNLISPDGTYLTFPAGDRFRIVSTKDGSFLTLSFMTGDSFQYNGMYHKIFSDKGFQLTHLKNQISLSVYVGNKIKLKGTAFTSDQQLTLHPYEYKAPSKTMNIKTLEVIPIEK